MPNRTTDDDREKLDHSSHPTTHATKNDLRAPGGGASEAPPPVSGQVSPQEQKDEVSDRSKQ
jgi:hypothetical protein